MAESDATNAISLALLCRANPSRNETERNVAADPSTSIWNG